VPGAISDVAAGVKPALAKVGNAATAVGESLDPDIVGLASPRAAHALRLASKVGKVATKLGGEAATETAPAAGELDATGENKDFAGEPPPKPAKPLDATGENKPFAGGMDEYTPAKPKTPRSIVTDPATGRPEFSDVVKAKQQTAHPPTQQPGPSPQPVPREAPEAPTSLQPTQQPGPSGDEMLDRLKGIAGRIAKQEGAAPGSAEPDLTQQLQDSLDFVRARKAVAAGKVQPSAIEAAPEPGAGVMTSAAPKDLLGRWGRRRGQLRPKDGNKPEG
jgi:hypothetical protein